MHLPLVGLLLVALRPAFAADAPATVLEHTEQVTVDGSGRLTVRRGWTVRVDDPVAASAGLPAPPGLDGASAGGASVMGDLLVVPGAGGPYALTATTSDRKGPWSGVYRTAPDLPVESARFGLSVPSWIGATVWADPRATPKFTRARSSRAVEYLWDGVPGDAPAAVVWTTWGSWDDAGAALGKVVDPKIADKQTLGSDLARNVEGVSVAELVERVGQFVTVYPEDYGTWAAARPAAEVLRAGEGTAADRAVVLLSLLRVAGYDARPALFEPAAKGSTAPLVVPAPAQLTRPAVAVVSTRRTVWIDPGSPWTAIPELPASMLGAVAWAPGQPPVVLGAHGATDGWITVNGLVRPDADGGATWSATIGATGAAVEWLRAALGPLDEAGRGAVLERLVRQARPDTDRFTLTASGLESPQRALKITVQGHDPDAFAAQGPATVGTLAPLLAPALAGWLPSRVLVHEETAFDSPEALLPVATVPGEATFHPEVVLARTVRHDGTKMMLVTEALRPERRDTPARAAVAAAWLEDAAPVGPRVLWLGLASPTLAKEIRADARFGSPVERVVTELLMWLTHDDMTQAKKTVKRALATIAPDALAAEIRRQATPGDPEPWQALALGSKDASVAIEVAEGLADAGLDRDAWLGAVALSVAESPAVRVRAYRLMYRLQPQTQPDAAADPLGAASWRPRTDLLAGAHEASRALGPNPVGGDVPTLLLKCRRDLDEGRASEALPVLERILAAGPDPVALVLHARARVSLGIAAADLVKAIDDGVRAAPFDATVLAEAARAMEDVGEPQRALSYGLAAARLAFTDPALWSDVSRQALAAGDLSTAVAAARRACDLDPADRDAAVRLQLVATLAGDQEAATVGATRAGRAASKAPWPSSFQGIVDLTPPDALFAVLQHHEVDVAADSRLLALRARLRLEHGELDGAARDGVLLASRHGDPEGWALAFGATAGRLWSSTGGGLLDKGLPDPGVRSARMEYALLSGEGDPVADAKLLADDPRAAVVLRTSKDPSGLAADTPDWPAGLVEPTKKGPVGWTANRALGAPVGVTAWSHPDLAASVLLVDAADYVLPPVLAHLWTPAVPDLASLADGGRLMRLDGGALPLYAATAPIGDDRAWALAFTPDAARRALDTALAAFR